MRTELHRRVGPSLWVSYDDRHMDVVARYRWHAHVSVAGLTYARTNVRISDGKRGSLLMHTLITGWDFVDHVDHNGLNNLDSNLRPSNRRFNAANMRMRSDGSSQYKGVRWHQRDKIWEANIKSLDRQIYLGRFTDEVDAALAYDEAARGLFGEHACLNFSVVMGGMG